MRKTPAVRFISDEKIYFMYITLYRWSWWSIHPWEQCYQQ